MNAIVKTVTPEEALIYLMVAMSAADQEMTDSELRRIGMMINNLPVFKEFDEKRLVEVAENCGELLSDENGLDDILNIVLASLPTSLHETAYAVAVEVAVADLHVEQEELRLLQIYQEALGLDKLICAAIERGAKARFKIL